MKQNVSTPVAAIVLALVILLSVVVFGRPRAGAGGKEQFVLPYAPPSDEGELATLRQGLEPLGIACLMPPLAGDQRKGARVALVAPEGPAGRGGMKPGDLVTSVNGIKVGGPYVIVGALRRADPKKPNAFVVIRAGKEKKLVIAGWMPAP